MRTRAVFLALILALAGTQAWQAFRVEKLQTSIADLKVALASANSTLETQIAQVAQTASSTAAAAELARRTQVVLKSEDEQLREAVAGVTPAVVSIVETQQVPQLQVEYVNPFGNDPFFRDMGIRVPVYHQVGTQEQKVGAGTGFFVRASGYIVTNRHVVADTNAKYTVLLSNGTQKEATVVWRGDDSHDLAVLKISGSGYKTIPLGNSTNISLGQTVFAVGNALGEYNNSVSVGIISGLNRSITAQGANGQVENLRGVIQTDAAINPGNSGGPLVDLLGRAVGVNVATVSGSQSIGFSVPINDVKTALANLGI